MDAKERLRLYLEQRRDAGESELVLDSMEVEDVMRLLGARSSRPAGSSRSGGDSAAALPSSRETARESTPDAGRDARRDVRRDVTPEGARDTTPSRVASPGDRVESARGEASGDWRAALRAIEPTRATGSREDVPRSDAERAPAPSPIPPSPIPPSPVTPRAVPPRAVPPTPVPSATAHAVPADEDSPAPTRAATHRDGSSSDDESRDASHATMPFELVPQGIVVGSPAHELFGGPSSPYATLDDVAAATRACTLCALHQTARQAVPGQGNPHADFVCVGEAPGATEDEQGVPFVGAAGQLLTKILAAIQLSREDVFICNVLKHRPPGNRNPNPDEVAACSPYLVRQIELIAPKVIVALGTFAAQTLLQTKEPIGRLRGKIHRYYGVPLIVTYHPAALLRNPSWKRPTWEDVQLARRLFDRARGT